MIMETNPETISSTEIEVQKQREQLGSTSGLIVKIASGVALLLFIIAWLFFTQYNVSFQKIGGGSYLLP